VDGGADINAKTPSGWTPLHYAARRGHYKVVELLLAKGADVNAETKDGRTALDCARVAGRSVVVRLLKAASDDESH